MFRMAWFVWGLAFWFLHVQNAQVASTSIPQKIPQGPTVPNIKGVNSKLLGLVIQDQWERGNDMFGNGRQHPVPLSDAAMLPSHTILRCRLSRIVVDTEKFVNIDDDGYALIICEHSSLPRDLMFAHLLALTIVEKKNSGRWWVAATMDRYLNSIQQPQIFGTQFWKHGDDPFTMEPYNWDTLTDAERALFCVVPRVQQEAILKHYQQTGVGATTEISGCK